MPSKWIPKIHRAKQDNTERHSCPAWPTVGLITGASREWCLESRGSMKACNDCDWREKKK